MKPLEQVPVSPPVIQGRVGLLLFPEHLALLDDPNSWLQELNDAYVAFQDLVGQAPYGGERIIIKEVDYYPGGELIAGNPILWFQDYVPGKLQSINDYNDLSFGPIHELGHDFDIPALSRYYMGGGPLGAEQWANFKLTYVADALSVLYPTATFYQAAVGYVPIGEFSHRYFVEQFALPWIDSGRTDWQNMSGDVYTGLLYMLKGQIGWEPFKQTFRDFASLTTSPPATDIGKIQLFGRMLSENAGQDLIPQFQRWGFPMTDFGEGFIYGRFFKDDNASGKRDYGEYYIGLGSVQSSMCPHVFVLKHNHLSILGNPPLNFDNSPESIFPDKCIAASPAFVTGRIPAVSYTVTVNKAWGWEVTGYTICYGSSCTTSSKASDPAFTSSFTVNVPSDENVILSIGLGIIPNLDSDRDGFLDGVESYIDTFWNKKCPSTPAQNDEFFDSWPPDFNDDKKVDMFDVNLFQPVFFSSLGDPAYNPRYDLNADGKIDIFDVNKVGSVFFKTCTP